MEELKICSKCNKELPLLKYFEFRSDTKKYRNHCKLCNKGYKELREDKKNRILNDFENGLKICSLCNKKLELSHFSNDKTTLTKVTSRCKKCISIKQNKTLAKNRAYKNRYNITIDDYNRLAEEQNYKCAICNENKFLVVDHCHTTNKVRGLLCTICNTSLGGFKDNINNLRQAIEYLNNNGKQNNITTYNI